MVSCAHFLFKCLALLLSSLRVGGNCVKALFSTVQHKMLGGRVQEQDLLAKFLLTATSPYLRMMQRYVGPFLLSLLPRHGFTCCQSALWLHCHSHMIGTALPSVSSWPADGCARGS